MAKAGIFGEDDPVELIAGEIITQMPIGTTHAGMVNRLNQLLTTLVRGRCIVSVQNPVALDVFSEPQPDLALLRSRPDFYSNSHPGPEDVLLIIEVADTSLAFDREEKIPLYAAAGISEVWLVDLVDKSLSVFRSPAQGTYSDVKRYRVDASIPIPGLPDAQLAIKELAF